MRRKSSTGTTIFNIVLVVLMFYAVMNALIYVHALFFTLIGLAILYAAFKG